MSRTAELAAAHPGVSLWERGREYREGRAWATNASLILLGLTLIRLTRQFISENDHFTIGNSGAAGWSVVVYMAAVLIILTQPTDKWTLRIILAMAVLCRLVPLYEDPFLSSDIYRYVWDGVVQHAHINPYRYIASDPALKFLQDPYIDEFKNMNRRDYAHTIYPPVAQMIYYCVTFVAPSVEGMKTAMVGFECLAVGAMVALLKRIGRPVEQVLLYAWCPLLIWEIGDAGHIDAAVIGFVAVALLYRAKGRDALVGLFLGLAFLTKFYPIVLFPALWRRGDWKMPTVIVGLTAFCYALYSSVGRGVLGFLGEYQHEEGMDTGARYFLLQLVDSWRGSAANAALSKQALAAQAHGFQVFALLIMAAISWWAWKHATIEGSVDAGGRRLPVGDEPNFLKAATMFAIALMLLFSPHYAWYIAWLIPFFCLAPRLPMFAYICGFFYLYTTALADPGPKMFLLNKILYGGTLGFFLLYLLLQKWPVHRWLHPGWRLSPRLDTARKV